MKIKTGNEKKNPWEGVGSWCLSVSSYGKSQNPAECFKFLHMGFFSWEFSPLSFHHASSTLRWKFCISRVAPCSALREMAGFPGLLSPVFRFSEIMFLFFIFVGLFQWLFLYSIHLVHFAIPPRERSYTWGYGLLPTEGFNKSGECFLTFERTIKKNHSYNIFSVFTESMRILVNLMQLFVKITLYAKKTWKTKNLDSGSLSWL